MRKRPKGRSYLSSLPLRVRDVRKRTSVGGGGVRAAGGRMLSYFKEFG